MKIRIIDKAGVSYDETPSRERTLPYQWSGDIPDKVAKNMIKAGSAKEVTVELDDDDKKEAASKNLEGQSDKKLLKKIDELDEENQRSVDDIATLIAQRNVLREVVLGFGTDEQLLDNYLTEPSQELFEQLMDENVNMDPDAIPDGIKPDADVVKIDSPIENPTELPPLSDKQTELLGKYKKFPKKTITDMLTADNIEHDEKATRDDLADILARAHGK